MHDADGIGYAAQLSPSERFHPDDFAVIEPAEMLARANPLAVFGGVESGMVEEAAGMALAGGAAVGAEVAGNAV
jgi:hypothetical protein